MPRLGKCFNCGELYELAPVQTQTCRRCNAALSREERQRRRDVRRENELREANGKDPIELPRVKEDIEYKEDSGFEVILVLLCLFAFFVVSIIFL